MGSVKDLTVQKEPTETEPGVGTFVFSDRYSVFDWGEMPDFIPGKGEVLASMGGYNFELLERKGIETHYRGLVERGSLIETEEISSPTNKMSITLAHKPVVVSKRGEYQYEDLTGRGNFLIPLEIVYRNYVPIGSSIRRRYEPDDIGLDYSEWPKEEIEVESPIIEFSTKLEKQDRYLTEVEALEISALTEGKFQELRKIAKKVNLYLTKHADKRNFKHLDGKIECIYDRGKIKVADVVGTFDENRFSYHGTQISKEILRQWYKKKDEKWYDEVVSAKERTRGNNSSAWTRLVGREPKSLNPKLQQFTAKLYQAGANEWLGKRIFAIEGLSQVLEGVNKWRAEKNL